MLTYQLSDAIDCLYDSYCRHTSKLKTAGYLEEEAFWIHLASVPFMPWRGQARVTMPLSHLLKFYAQVYREEILGGNREETRVSLRSLLKDKFISAFSLAVRPQNSRFTLQLALEIGRRVLPEVNDSLKQAHAGLFILNIESEWERMDRLSPLGRLVRDM